MRSTVPVGGGRSPLAFGNVIPAFQKHCLPHKDFVRRIPEYSAEFARLAGNADLRPSRIREFIKGRNFTITDDGAICRATVAAFGAYMRDFHNCMIRPSGLIRKSVTISQGSYSADFFDLFSRVMFERLEIPEHLKGKQITLGGGGSARRSEVEEWVLATAGHSGDQVAAFIKPLPGHWTPDDFLLVGATLRGPVQHVARTVCLLESRCNDYADYLRAIVLNRGDRWVAAVDLWNAEECQHGELLRRLCEAIDPAFPFDDLMGRYTRRVSYHLASGHSVRGSLGAELVSRCVVEALASTLYRVLADAEECVQGRHVFTALAQDEARHFGMFSRMLAAEAELAGKLGPLARCGHALRRMAALEDGQIMVASAVVGGRDSGPVSPRAEANRYLAGLFGLYRWQHLRYAARMLLMTVGVCPTRSRVTVFTAALWVGVKVRWAWAHVSALLLRSRVAGRGALSPAVERAEPVSRANRR